MSKLPKVAKGGHGVLCDVPKLVRVASHIVMNHDFFSMVGFLSGLQIVLICQFGLRCSATTLTQLIMSCCFQFICRFVDERALEKGGSSKYRLINPDVDLVSLCGVYHSDSTSLIFFTSDEATTFSGVHSSLSPPAWMVLAVYETWQTATGAGL